MAAPTTEILLTELGDGVVRVALNRPHKANALSPSLLGELEASLDAAAADRGVRVAVISGEGAGFSGGYDIQPSSAGSQPDVVDDAERLRGLAQRWLRIRDKPIATVAQVHGYCLGGGLELMLACDLAICADDAQIGFPAVRAQGVPLILAYPWLMPIRDAKELLWTGDPVTGKEAAAARLVNRSVPPDELAGAAEALAARVARLPRELLTLGKRALHRAQDASGFHLGVASGVEYDALAHLTEPARRFREVAEESGLAAALRWRDQGGRG